MAINSPGMRPPWPKGVSGNPSGNSMPAEQRKKLHQAKVMAADHAVEAVQTYIELMRDSIDGVRLAAAREVAKVAGLDTDAAFSLDPDGGLVLKWPLPKTKLDQ